MYTPNSIMMLLKSRNTSWAGHVALGGTRNANGVMTVNPNGSSLRGMTILTWVSEEIERGECGLDCLAHYRD
jgi:hypothetical protein